MAIPLFFFFGWLSDKIGRKYIILAGLLLAVVSYRFIYEDMYQTANLENKKAVTVAHNSALKQPEVYPKTTQYTDGTVVKETLDKKSKTPKVTLTKTLTNDAQWHLIWMVFLQIVFVTMVYAPIASYLVELFAVSVRYTTLSFAYHTGNGIFGGLVPGVSTYLVTSAKDAANRALVPQALAESGQPLHAWRERLLAALTGEARLLFDVLPELALALGPQPPVPALPPVERANRFRRVFRQLLRCLARPQHPLVVVLEDLQWFDPATLQLLDEILGAGDTQHLLVVASLRGDEPEPGSPLAATIAALAARGLAPLREAVRPLRRDEVAAWLAEALHPCPQDLGALIDLAHASSAGNPFLLRLLAESLYEQRALRFNGELGVWEWRPQQAAQARLPDDLGALVTDRLRELPPATRAAVSTAACVGLRCELRLLASLLEESPGGVVAVLREAEARGLMLAASGGYQFLHERVQQAASAELSPARAQALHLAIGRALMGSDAGDFEVVHHLNLGVALVTDASERRELAARNLAAAQRALAATAVASAAAYARAGAAALGAGGWGLGISGPRRGRSWASYHSRPATRSRSRVCSTPSRTINGCRLAISRSSARRTKPVNRAARSPATRGS